MNEAVLKNEILEKLQSVAFCKKLLSLEDKAEVKKLFESEDVDVNNEDINLLAEAIKALVSLQKEDLQKGKDLHEMSEADLISISGGDTTNSSQAMTTSETVQLRAIQAMLVPLAASAITYANVEKATGSTKLATLASVPVGLVSAALILPSAALVASGASVCVWFNNLE